MKRSHFSDIEPRIPGTFVPFFLKAPPSTLSCSPFFFFFMVVLPFCQGCLHIASYLCHFCLFITHSFHLFCFYSFNFIFHFLPFFSYSCPPALDWMFFLLLIVSPVFLLYFLPTPPVHSFLAFFPLCSHHYFTF